MNVFDLRQRLVDDYADYTRSSVNISDPRIEAHVEQELKDGLLWPHPIVQLNTAFESGGHIADAGHRCAPAQTEVEGRDLLRRDQETREVVRLVDMEGSDARAAPGMTCPWFNARGR